MFFTLIFDFLLFDLHFTLPENSRFHLVLHLLLFLLASYLCESL